MVPNRAQPFSFQQELLRRVPVAETDGVFSSFALDIDQQIPRVDGQLPHLKRKTTFT